MVGRSQFQIQRPVLQVHEIRDDGAREAANHLAVERDEGDRGVVDAANHALGLGGCGGVEHRERGRNVASMRAMLLRERM